MKRFPAFANKQTLGPRYAMGIGFAEGGRPINLPWRDQRLTSHLDLMVCMALGIDMAGTLTRRSQSCKRLKELISQIVFSQPGQLGSVSL